MCVTPSNLGIHVILGNRSRRLASHQPRGLTKPDEYAVAPSVSLRGDARMLQVTLARCPISLHRSHLQFRPSVRRDERKKNERTPQMRKEVGWPTSGRSIRKTLECSRRTSGCFTSGNKKKKVKRKRCRPEEGLAGHSFPPIPRLRNYSCQFPDIGVAKCISETRDGTIACSYLCGSPRKKHTSKED